MSEVDKEFAEKALNDIDFAKDQQRYMDGHNSEANKFSAYADDYASKRAEAEKQQANFNARTTPIRDVAFYLSRMEEMSGGRYGPEYGQISEAATKYLDNLVKNGLSAKEAAEIRSGKEPKVDIDGSKQSFFGRLKNKVKNIWKPNNPKLAMEESIAKLKIAMANDPDLMFDMKRATSATIHNYAYNFKEVAEKVGAFSKDYNDTRVYYMHREQKSTQWAQEEAAKAQKNQTTLDAITEVRDKAAKEIELRAEARENIGIKDAQANTGIDRLADKAKAMEGMTPEQRLAFRMSQLRGTAKETPAKPIIKREMDSNIMNKALESKMRA